MLTMWVTRFLWLALGVAVIGACTPNAPPQLDLVEGLPLPGGASSISRVLLDANPHRQQLFFTLKASHPSVVALEQLQAHFERNSWIQCRGKTSSWDSFVDMSSTPANRVHQISAIWSSPDRRTFAFAVGRYLSKPEAGIDKPDNDEQRWVVVVQRNVDAEREAKTLGYSCGGK